MKKRIFAFFTSIAMILSILPMAFAEDAGCRFGDECPSKGYTDLPVDSWYHDYVDNMLKYGLMKGVSDTEFAPQEGLTRAMIAVVFWRMFEEKEPQAAPSFTDVSADAWYADAVAYGEELGLIKGMGDGSYAPNEFISREQMAVLLYRLKEVSGIYGKAEADLADFQDGETVSAWAEEAMVWAVSEGLFAGDEQGFLNPAAPAKRCEGAALIARFIEIDPVVPDHIVDQADEMIAAIAKGGAIVLEKAITLPSDQVIEIAKDTTLYLYGDLDAEAHPSRPFAVKEGTAFTIDARDQTVKMGAYGLINIPNGDGITIDLYGGKYVGKTDNGSLIKPRGNGEMSIRMYDVQVSDRSENGGWLVHGGAHKGTLNVTINGGTFEAYNGIVSAESMDINGAAMTFTHTGLHAMKEATINNCTIRVLDGGSETEKHASPSAAVIAYGNGHVDLCNSVLDGAANAMAVYTSGGSIQAQAVTILNGAISEYHPRDHYPEARFEITVDGETPEDLKFPNCEDKTPCRNCR